MCSPRGYTVMGGPPSPRPRHQVAHWQHATHQLAPVEQQLPGATSSLTGSARRPQAGPQITSLLGDRRPGARAGDVPAPGPRDRTVFRTPPKGCGRARGRQ